MPDMRHLLDLLAEAPQSLQEGRDAPIFHQMHLDKARSVFAADALLARDEAQTLWAHRSSGDEDQPGYRSERPFQRSTDNGGMQALHGTSFTRNKRLDLTQGGGFGRKIVSLVADQARVAQTNRIVPINADLSVRNFPAFGSGSFNDRVHVRPGDDSAHFAEEFVLGHMKPLHRYLTGIVLLIDRDGLTAHRMKQIKAIDVIAYCQRWGIPLSWRDGTPVVADHFKGRGRAKAA